MLLRMHRFFFSFQKQPISKCVFLRSPQILSFNSLIYTTNTEVKRIPDACPLQSGCTGGAREGQVRTPSAGAAPRVRGAGTGRANRPLGPQPAPHHCDPESPAPPSRPALLLPAGSDRRAATAAERPGDSAGDAAPAPSADPAAPSWERKVWTRKYIDRPHLSGNTGAINQGRRRKDAAPAPARQLAARPVTFPPCPVLSPPWRSRLLLSSCSSAPSSPRRCSRARPGAASGVRTRAHTRPHSHSPGRGARCLPPEPHGRVASPGVSGVEGVSTCVAFSPGGRGGGRGLESVTSWGSAAAGDPGCARRVREGSAHCEPEVGG